MPLAHESWRQSPSSPEQGERPRPAPARESGCPGSSTACERRRAQNPLVHRTRSAVAHHEEYPTPPPGIRCPQHAAGRNREPLCLRQCFETTVPRTSPARCSTVRRCGPLAGTTPYRRPWHRLLPLQRRRTRLPYRQPVRRTPHEAPPPTPGFRQVRSAAHEPAVEPHPGHQERPVSHSALRHPPYGLNCTSHAEMCVRTSRGASLW